MIIIVFLIVILVIACAVTAIVVLIQKNTELTQINKKYEPIMDIEKEAERVKQEAESIIIRMKDEAFADHANQKKVSLIELENISTEKERLLGEIDSISSELESLLTQKNSLQYEINLLEEKDLLYSQGLYEPKYKFDKFVEYERELINIREKQKDAIRNETAVIYVSKTPPLPNEKKSLKNIVSLVTRAFNSECDVFCSKVNYKNVVTYEQRIKKLRDQINNLISRSMLQITKEYMNLKISELQIVHELEEKKEQEAELQRQIKEIMRDELKAEREIEKAQKEAEKEERIYETALNKALADAKIATGEKHELLQNKISLLQAQLEEAKQKKERAISRAQQTKSGHVYIISNIGSFGDNVFKIGMTRRLEPMERVKELSSASVPFEFDVHAIIYSENAPELENVLHKACEPFRMNKVNSRKEFFRVDIDSIEALAKKHDPEIFFTRIPEAKDYRTSKALMEKFLS